LDNAGVEDALLALAPLSLARVKSGGTWGVGERA
jgi:hypothetical protein